jgi:hypothetical protein
VDVRHHLGRGVLWQFATDVASRWNQHRIRIEAGKQTPIALTSPGAPSLVMVVGMGAPVQQVVEELRPTHLRLLVADREMQQMLRPSAAMRYPTSSASFAPCRRSDSKIASTKCTPPRPWTGHGWMNA